jgi:predicted DNA-binding transcriptional regulator YafY
MSSQLLYKAIEGRVAISFRHEGQQWSVEPYSVGYNQPLVRTAGPLILRAWSLETAAWRDFEVRHMSSLVLSNSHFAGDRPDHADLLWVLRDIWGRADGQANL